MWPRSPDQSPSVWFCCFWSSQFLFPLLGWTVTTVIHSKSQICIMQIGTVFVKALKYLLFMKKYTNTLPMRIVLQVPTTVDAKKILQQLMW